MPRIYLSPPDVGDEERALLLDAFDSNWIAPLGPHVDAFEHEMASYLGGDIHAVALSSGTAALHLSLVILGVCAGDTVVVSNLTFAATANAARYVGAEPVFIDSDRETWNLDPRLLEEELAESARKGALPKAIIAVDLYGQCADYERLRAVASQYGVPVIEDAAEALGATYRGQAAGTLGDFGVLSFNGNKIITTSGGGMLLCRDAARASLARKLATQAREPAPHYEHTLVGYNYRMSNLLAALGRGQLRGLNAKVARRRSHYEYYSSRFAAVPGLQVMPMADYGRSNCWLSCVLIDGEEFGASREQVRLALEAQDIEARPVWKPMHMQPVYRSCRVRGGIVSEALFERGLCIPSGSRLSDSERETIADIVLSCGRHS